MRTVQIGQHEVIAPKRDDLLEAKKLFITALGQWSILLFSTGDLVASDEGWDTLSKLLALFPVKDAGTRVSLSEVENDLEAIERLFLSGVSPSPGSVIYENTGGRYSPAPTENIVQNYTSPALLELCCFPLWQVLPQALSASGMTPPQPAAE
jgi:hypothetical protein